MHGRSLLRPSFSALSIATESKEKILVYLLVILRRNWESYELKLLWMKKAYGKKAPELNKKMIVLHNKLRKAECGQKGSHQAWQKDEQGRN